MMQRAGCGFGSSFTVTSVITASMPFRADHQRQQVVARRVERLGAELDRLAVDGEAAHAQHVVHRQAVLQAVHAAGVLGDVAADRAGDLARGVGRVVQAVRRRRLGDREVAHAGLHDARCAPSGSSARMRLNLASDSSTPSPVRQRAARQPGAGAARAPPARRARGRCAAPLHLRLGLRQRDHQRQLAVGGQAVALVGPRVLLLPEQGARRQEGAQRRRDLALARGVY